MIAESGFEEDELLRPAAAVEEKLEHPLAAALYRGRTRDPSPAASDFRAIPGQGVQGSVNGAPVLLGTAKMSGHGLDLGPLKAEAERLAEDGKTAVYVAVDGHIAGVEAVADTLKEDSRSVRPTAPGIEVAVIAGDNRHAREAIARQVGIDLRPG